jgi:diguanylate cyclase (GGDEF)-like protein/PAS domain S-box-containing protein
MNNSPIRVLLVEDNEDDYIITRDLLADVQDVEFELEWVATYDTALATIACQKHDVYLLDYRIGAHNGLEILQQMLANGYDAPIILLTGSSTRTIDLEAMQLGATDFLSKNEISGGQLERTLRYAIRQRQLYQQVKHQAQREQALNHIVGVIRNTLDLDDIFSTATHELAQLLQADRVGIVQYHAEQQQWCIVSDHRRHPDLPNVLGMTFPDEGSEIATRLKHLEILQLKTHDTCINPIDQALVQSCLGAWLLIPLQVGSTIWGNLRLVRDGQLFCWQDWEIELTRAIAAQLAIAIQQSQLYQQVQQLNITLEKEKELAQVTLQSIGDAVITTDAQGQIQYLNPVAETLVGWSQAEVQGQRLVDVFHLVHEITREPVQNPVEEALREGHIAKLTKNTILLTRNGRELPIDDSAAPIRANDGQIVGAVMVFQDVSHTRSLTHQLSWQASHDVLTGLVNRREFENYLDEALKIARELDQTHVLCYLDLDNFKIVNDTCGHAAGDQLLRQAAALFQAQIRKTDALARLGGDEFGILLNHCPLDQAVRIANTLRDHVKAFRFVWQDKLFTIGVSIGIALITADTKSVTSVLSAADSACYAAKNSGRNRVHIYQIDDLNLARQQGEMQWVTRLTQALEENRFCLYCQSIVPTTPTPLNQRHHEILLRLWDETGNLIPPGAFIPAAERYNLMNQIDRWVIRSLFELLGQHQCTVERCNPKPYPSQDPQSDCLYAVNLSGASINDDEFVDFLQEQFALHQIPPSRLCFEITETVAIANLTEAAQFITNLRNLGCRFALDDFGSGMSSFAYLKNLPVDYLKIDGSFVKNIINDPVDFVMVEAIHQIGQAMGIQTIAEFVENDAILEKVTTLGVTYAQGYGIDQPHPLVFN